MEKFDVSLVSCDSYEEPLKEKLNELIEAVDGWSFIKPNMTVAIKANLVLAGKPEKAATTHPSLINALCELLCEKGVGKVIVGDSPGGLYTSAYLNHVYSATGIRTCCEHGGETNQDFSTENDTFSEGKSMHEFTYTAWVKKADVIINFSKLKSHGMMGMSAAVKNLFGCIPGTMKAEYHSRFPEHSKFADMLVDLNEYFKPVLCICDGIIGMEGNGPTAGDPRKIGVLLASKSSYALDLVAAHIIGLTPESVPTLMSAIHRGLSPKDYRELSVYGDVEAKRLEDFKNIAIKKNIDFGNFGTKFTKIFYKIAGKILRSKPKTDRSMCIGCGKCAEVCPKKTIVIKNGKAVIYRKNCIRCFCCQEFCPVGAMKVHRSWICRLLVKNKTKGK